MTAKPALGPAPDRCITDLTPALAGRQESVTATIGHQRRTFGGSDYRQLQNIEGAPFTRSDCWLHDCRERWQPYLTVRVFLSRHGGDPIFVSAPCHAYFDPWTDLRPDVRAWIEGFER